MAKNKNEPAQWRSKIVGHGKVAADQLLANPFNHRRHPQKQRDVVSASIQELGFIKSVIVNRLTGHIVDGHERVMQALGVGEETLIDVEYVELSPEDEKKALLILDASSELAELDASQLNLLVGDCSFNLDALNDLASEMLESVTINPDPEIHEDDVPAVPSDPITKPGDLWVLGPHRVLCGSSLEPSSMARLFKDKTAQMIFTDPPYNVAYVGGTKEKLTIKNDAMSGDDFLSFLRSAFKTMGEVLDPGGAVYVCHADSEGERFRNAFCAAGFELKQCLIWVKNSLVLGRQDYQWRHEPILYGWRSGARHSFYGGRKRTTVIDDSEGLTIRDSEDGKKEITISFNGRTVILKVDNYSVSYDGDDSQESTWRFDKPSRNGDHPTMKPIRLVARAIVNSSAPADIVLDGFLGSGSTLIASDQTGRVCYGTELDPRYCDVIVKRWENMTGKKAILEERVA